MDRDVTITCPRCGEEIVFATEPMDNGRDGWDYASWTQAWMCDDQPDCACEFGEAEREALEDAATEVASTRVAAGTEDA